MATTLVRPANGRQEQKYLLLTVAVVVFVCALLIGRQRTENRIQQLLSYQISAFSDLTPPEQALFNDLYAAGLELQAVHRDERHWLTVPELTDQGIPPFGDARFTWTARISDNVNIPAVAYLGTAAGGGRSFLLTIGAQDSLAGIPHVHFDVLGLGPQHKTIYRAEIWVTAAARPAMPVEFDPLTLGGLGWRQAVAFKGQEARGGTAAAP